jgi:hypothetical protein
LSVMWEFGEGEIIRDWVAECLRFEFRYIMMLACSRDHHVLGKCDPRNWPLEKKC